MAVEIRDVRTLGDLKAFVRFPYRLYRGNPYWVPPLLKGEMSTLDRKKNPAFEYCEAAFWLALKDGRVAGRIAGIVNRKFVDIWKTPTAGFGWFDVIDDTEVSGALLDTVEKWARDRGMTAVQGPMGLTNFDHQGLLIEGFEELPTIASAYNYPYYLTHLEARGYVKENDYLEFEVKPPDRIPEKIQRIADVVMKRKGIRLIKPHGKKELLPHAKAVFEIINRTYSHLFAYVPLSDRQIDYYTRKYFSFLHPEYVSLLADSDDRLVGFQITMPSLSRAMQKARGRLYPFGWLHLLKALKKPRTIDLYLVGILPEYQNQGLNAVFMVDLCRIAIKNRIEKAETNSEQEDNKKIQDFWKHFESRRHKKKRIVKKTI